jgi:twitching motility protein PilT
VGGRGEMDIFSILHIAKSSNASDLHLVVSSPPLLRVNGSLEPVNGAEPVTATEISQALLQVTTPEERETFTRHLELDFGYTLPDGTRLRCNAAQQRGAISLAMRLLPPTIPTIEELELPQICKELALRPRGLVIVTGPTGSGKTTTQAAMIQHLNINESRHVVTIEDPIEYVHPSINCAITQRQLGSDTLSFAQALKHILRQDPDVILVGEMRDLETAAAVLTIAETGHLILSTGHAPSTHQAIERIIDLFPPHERFLAQTRLASLLIGVLCQTLVPRADGSGRIAAVEIMLANPPVRNLIREGKMYQLPNVIRTHREIGMISLDEALVDLYLRRIIGGETLLAYCNDRQEVEKLIGRVEIERAPWPFITYGEGGYERATKASTIHHKLATLHARGN